MKRLYDLATAHATQTDREGKPISEWIVKDEDANELYRLPSRWNEKDVMAAIHFAREFEAKAFNKGVNYQKEKQPQQMKELQKMVVKFDSERKIMKDRNIELANELEKLNSQLDKIMLKTEIK